MHLISGDPNSGTSNSGSSNVRKLYPELSRGSSTEQNRNDKELYSDLILVSEQYNNDVRVFHQEIIEPILMYLELIKAHQELCNRYENDLRKNSPGDNQAGDGPNSGSNLAQFKIKFERLASRQNNNNQDDGESIEELEKRNSFKLHCIYSETILLKLYSEIFIKIKHRFFKTRTEFHQKLAQLFME